jgi:hypothetical protein
MGVVVHHEHLLNCYTKKIVTQDECFIYHVEIMYLNSCHGYANYPEIETIFIFMALQLILHLPCCICAM